MKTGATIAAAGAILTGVSAGTAQGQDVLLLDSPVRSGHSVRSWSVGDMFDPTYKSPVRFIGCNPDFEKFFMNKVESVELEDILVRFEQQRLRTPVSYLCQRFWSQIDMPDPGYLASVKWVYAMCGGFCGKPHSRLNAAGLPNLFAVPDSKGIVRLVSATLRGTPLTVQHGWYLEAHTRSSKIEFPIFTQVCLPFSR